MYSLVFGISTGFWSAKIPASTLEFSVTGYSLGHVPHSNCDNSQCSLAPDYGYKRWSTDREAPRAYTQPEGIGYLTETLSWIAKLLNQNLTSRTTENDEWYSQTERFFASVIWFQKNNPLSGKTVRASRLFTSVKLQQPTIFKKMAPSGLHCPLYSTLVTRSFQIHRHWTLLNSKKSRQH